MHIFIEKLQKFSKFSRKCDMVVIVKQLYIAKLSSYIKEQLKFALFLGVEGGGKNSPLKTPTLFCNDRNQYIFNAKF